MQYHHPNPDRARFARTNQQTIKQRATLIQELHPAVHSIGELCCGDCTFQAAHYAEALNIARYRSLDLEPDIVAANVAAGIDCVCGNVMDQKVLRSFLDCDIVFYGPPLSIECDGHQLLTFQNVTPSFTDFMTRFLKELAFDGTLVCIAPKSTTLGDISKLYHAVRKMRPDVGLHLIHHTWSTVTGSGATTPPRLKYVELWFSSTLADAWDHRTSGKGA